MWLLSRKFCLCLCGIMLFGLYFLQEARSQYYLIGTDPAGIKWRQIKTQNFKVVYPSFLEEAGQYISNGLEYIYQPGGRTLFDKTPRTPVIVRSQTTVPSSVTYIAPRRMEFFTTPPQDIYPQDWTDQLIIHEFRHAVQYSAINTGFTRGLSCLLGEQGVFGIFGLFLPLWFIEGDATVAETGLHTTGRGRTPSFEMRLRSQMVEKGIYSYEKANYGSYTDFVPGKYELGYQLVGWSRLNWGPWIWSDVLNNVGRHPYTLNAFSSSLKKQTGLNKYRLYDSLTKQIQNNWLIEERRNKENDYEILTGLRNNLYTSYNIPVIFRDSLIVAFRSSIDDLTGAVVIGKNGRDKDLFTVGTNFYLESLTANDTLIFWSELINDPRWLLRDYRVIKYYNCITGRTRQLTHRTRYFAPALSKTGMFLAASEVTPENKNLLVILDAADGSLLKKISTPDNLLFIHPCWSEDGKSIVSVVFGRKGNSIALVDTGTGDTEKLIPFSDMEIKRPSFWGDHILFTASYNGKDNIYALNPENSEIFRITSARFGASDAVISNDKKSLIYSNYTADGYQIVKEMLDPSKWVSVSVPEKSAFPLAEGLTAQEGFIYDKDSVPAVEYISKPYKKIPNLINFHSWAPVGIDFQNFSAAPGATLISQNLLGTTITTLGYQYNRNERTGRFSFYLSDESRYTAFDVGFDYGGRKDMGVYSRNDSVPEIWKELNVTGRSRLPFHWTHNSWIRSFVTAVGLNYKFLEMDESVPVNFEYERFITASYSLTFSNERKMSLRDIKPRWSQKFQVDYINTPAIDASNSIFAAQATADLPGFTGHNGIRLYAGYQKKKESFYSFTDQIILPRGYENIFRNEIYSFSAMYTMPLFYPEWRIGHLFYFKRFKTTLFYDFAKSNDHYLPDFFSSAGLDLSSDFSLLNLIAPLDAGIRLIYIPETERMKFELLFSLNFGAMY